MERQYRAGDVLVREALTPGGGGRYPRRYVVCDPPYTSRGKLRLQGEGLRTVATTWWGQYPGDTWLPKGWRVA